MARRKRADKQRLRQQLAHTAQQLRNKEDQCRRQQSDIDRMRCEAVKREALVEWLKERNAKVVEELNERKARDRR